MTVIAAYIDEKRAIVAADSMVSDGELGGESRLPKIRVVTTPFGDAVVGTAGDASSCNIITLLTTLPKRKKGESRIQYFMDSVPVSWKRAMVRRGLDPANMQGEVMLVLPEEIWTYDSNLAADLQGHRFWAIGSGAHIALGAMHADFCGLCAEDHAEGILIDSIGVAAKYVINVGGEVLVAKVHKGGSQQ